jgi:hypothetical protein
MAWLITRKKFVQGQINKLRGRMEVNTQQPWMGKTHGGKSKL